MGKDWNRSMKVSIVIPAKNEEDCIEETITCLIKKLNEENIDFEIIVVNDNSTDRTLQIIERLASRYNNILIVRRTFIAGFGRAIRDGLEKVQGDMVVICMGDLSDDPADIVKYYRKIQEGYDCVFGSRFVRGAMVKDYPLIKLIINRIANIFIKYLFRIKNNDITNAFKAYRVEVIKSVMPLVSNHFNITVEIPLKAIVRGFSYTTVPINWRGRKSGVSKHKLKALQRKYLFSVLYVLFEKILLKDEVNEKYKK